MRTDLALDTIRFSYVHVKLLPRSRFIPFNNVILGYHSQIGVTAFMRFDVHAFKNVSVLVLVMTPVPRYVVFANSSKLRALWLFWHNYTALGLRQRQFYANVGVVRRYFFA